jgi:hypothetical protein
MFCRLSFVFLAIVLSVLFRYTEFDYSFGIFKLFLIRPTWMQWLYKVRLMRNDMNCSLFRIVFQRFFRMNRNSGICVWDLLCLLVFLSSFFSVLLCILFYLFLFGGCCGAWPVSVVFLLTFWFPYSFFSKQLVINSYMQFYHNIVGF